MKHTDQVLGLLQKQIGNDEEVQGYRQDGKGGGRQVGQSGGRQQGRDQRACLWSCPERKNRGLVSTGAMGADEGYKTIIVLTSDNDPLYDQTLGRVQEAFPGIDILGKNDFKDADAFIERIKASTCRRRCNQKCQSVRDLIDNFKRGRVRRSSCLIIDDEADQASPNTRASRDDGTKSPINERIPSYVPSSRNTYLQVTATPQALFLQRPGHSFRPKFTVLSHPGHDYVGGEDFFADKSKLVKEFDLQDIAVLAPGSQPSPKLDIPTSLLRALDTFMIGATYKRTSDAEQNCAFLCHVSTRTSDHGHIVDLLRSYKTDLAAGLKSKNAKVIRRLREAYDDFAQTHEGLERTAFDSLLDAIEFFSPGITVKLVNGETDEDVAVRSPYNLFVGGNKLGRGVTIKNLLVSYYGRHPKKPQADTVLNTPECTAIARKDIGLLRLFLPGAAYGFQGDQ